MEENKINASDINWVRLAHNFLQSQRGGNYAPQDLDTLNLYLQNVFNPAFRELPKYKIGVLLVCINQHYWEFMEPVVRDIGRYFLPGHDVHTLVWSDVQEKESYDSGLKGEIFPTDSIEWPYPTLLRYNLFLQEEEKLKDYDYLFYIDLDMRIVNVVGDEILGSGLTIAPHPGYAVRKELWPPYEPNPLSASYIKRPGKVVMMEGKPRFMPFYAAGGFQGGRAAEYIKAMKGTAKIIDRDLTNNYIPIWNDESAWNKYVFDVQSQEEIDKTVFLTPSYVYPDSLINEYYTKLWGCNYPPKIVTLTKKFSLNKNDFGELAARIATM